VKGANIELLDEVANLLSAASRTKVSGARAIYVAEARILVEQAKAKAKELDELTSAQEAEMVRMVRAAEATP
jgi:hypothetical protein